MKSLWFSLFCLLVVSPAWGEDYSENPDVIKALTRYHVSHQFARKRLVRDLEKSQNAAMQEKKLDEALAIQTYREKIKTGAVIPRDFPELRLGLDGLRYQWGRIFDRRFNIYLNFTAAQLHWEEPSRENRTAYKPIGSRELLSGPNHILFSPDLKRFIYLQPNFELRTGICLNPKANLPQIPKASPDQSALREGINPGEEWSGNELGMPLCWCPPGTFPMGSPPTEEGHQDTENQVQVTLTEGFWLGKYEVTQSEWKHVIGTSPWSGKAYVQEWSRYPASYMTWHEAIRYCETFTEQEREAGRLPKGWEYTLPTEAQWEYACRAGTTTAYSFGADASELSHYAWWGGSVGNGNAKDKQCPQIVGQKKANPWGLHDVHGNVSKWCRDSFQANLPGGNDPEVSIQGAKRAIRVGAWSSAGNWSRSAFRGSRSENARHDYLGFRVALVRRR